MFLTEKLEKLWLKQYSVFVVVCYFFLGLCNNFAYVVMLSAAHDILSGDETKTNSTSKSTENGLNKTYNKYDCNELSTGTILLADILPGVFVKSFGPFIVHKLKYWQRFIIVVTVNTGCYLTVALTPSDLQWLIFIGVCFASISISLGEITFLSLTTLYSKKLSLLGWGSGTGAAGLFGSLSYAGLTSLGISPRKTILTMLFIPGLMIISFVLLPSVHFTKTHFSHLHEEEEKENARHNSSVFKLENKVSPISEVNDEKMEKMEMESSQMGFLSKLKIIPSLLKYMIPLFLVYLSQYFINQGLFELLYFENSPFLTEHKTQYRWYSALYGAGVFISRSSIRFIQIKFLPIFPILQIVNVLIALSQIFFGYMPSIWIIIVLILWEGIVAGSCYVNAFNLVSIEVPKQNKEFAIAITSLANSCGVALAGFISIPVHNAICELGYK